MKKLIIKTVVFVLAFITSVTITGKYMNRGNNDMTMKMGAATLPVVSFWQGETIVNELYGHTVKMDVSSMASTVIQLGEERELTFQVEPFQALIEEMVLEVRSCDGERLIEQVKIADYEMEDGVLRVSTQLKDLLEEDNEYALVVVLEDGDGREIRYYTRCIWGTEVHAAEKVSFVRDFYEKTFDKEEAKELTKYLESNSSGDNTTLHKVNIHSSFAQVTWGDLPVAPAAEPVIDILELRKDTGSFRLKSLVFSGSGEETAYYRVEEFYRIRYTPSRIYLLDFERTMTQLPMAEEDIYANDKILLGIVGTEIPLAESADGNYLVFETTGRLCCYNAKDNKMSLLYSFYDAENWDVRTLNDSHDIKILNIDDNGNVDFAVYGYFNRGKHEGKTGIGIYRFNHALNTIEETVYIPYEKSWEVLKCDIEKILYLNQNNKLYVYMNQNVYEVELESRTAHPLVSLSAGDTIHVSPNHQIVLWNQKGSLQVRNLEAEKKVDIRVNSGEITQALGFMGDDIIYGVIRESDIIEDPSGKEIRPMYRVVISNSNGNVLKEYQEENIYTISVDLVDNQINLNCVKKTETGHYVDTVQEHIVNNEEQVRGKNKLVTVAVDVYETITQIQVKNHIDEKTIQLLTPKEVVFEGNRDMELEKTAEQKQFYVYNRYGIAEVCSDPAQAISLAYETSGRVVDESGKTVWFKGNRVTRNQIMAITAPEKTTKEASLAVCLDTMLKLEGITAQSQLLLEEDKDVVEILQSQIIHAQAADLTGCPMDALLYFVNKDIPVLAILADGEAVLITGFNEYNTVIFEPSTGKLYKKGMNDSAKWFEQNGNRFITYFRYNT